MNPISILTESIQDGPAPYMPEVGDVVEFYSHGIWRGVVAPNQFWDQFWDKDRQLPPNHVVVIVERPMSTRLLVLSKPIGILDFVYRPKLGDRVEIGSSMDPWVGEIAALPELMTKTGMFKEKDLKDPRLVLSTLVHIDSIPNSCAYSCAYNLLHLREPNQ